jgi:hypothetical protein
MRRLDEDVVTVDERDEGLAHRNVDRLEKLANRPVHGLKLVENFVIGPFSNRHMHVTRR